MTARRRICVVTGSRADYGLLRGLLRRLHNNPAVELQLVVTAAHLQPAFGLTVNEIAADNIPIAARVPLPLDGGTPLDAAKALGHGVDNLAEALHRLSPQVVIVLGDRIELLAVASVCLIFGIPLAHIHGGEVTEGAIDDSVRHALTKMSHLHFPAVDIYRDRILQMGEMPERVVLVGAPGLDNIAETSFMSQDELERDLNLSISEPLLIATCHSETAADAPEAAAEAMLEALADFPQARIVFTKANVDPGGDAINRMVDWWVAKRANATVFASLGVRRYLSLLKFASAVVGNSSSGIIEAPALGVATVDIGDRQKGRLKATSIIQCAANAASVRGAIAQALSPEFQAAARSTQPPYGRGGAAKAIYDTITTCDLSGLLKKTFVDRPRA